MRKAVALRRALMVYLPRLDAAGHAYRETTRADDPAGKTAAVECFKRDWPFLRKLSQELLKPAIRRQEWFAHTHVVMCCTSVALVLDRLNPRDRVRWFAPPIVHARCRTWKHAEAMLLLSTGNTCVDSEHLSVAIRFLNRAAHLADDLDDTTLAHLAFIHLGRAHSRAGNIQEARRCLKRVAGGPMEETAVGIPVSTFANASLVILGGGGSGDTSPNEDLWRLLDDDRSPQALRVAVFCTLSSAAMRRECVDEAYELATKATLLVADDSGIAPIIRYGAFISLGKAQRAKGEMDKALLSFRRALRYARECGYSHGEVTGNRLVRELGP